MSNALAIAGVTAVLKNLLDNAVIDSSLTSALGGTVTVTTLPPDRAFRPENNEENRINLFLFQVTYNAGWRNVGLPSRDVQGRRISNAPLALNLHYLLSVNGAQEFQAEILLGYAMQLLHETPVLTRDSILHTLQNGSPVSATGVLPPEYASLVAAQLAEQVEQLKIVPQYLNTEELSRFWSTFQTNYRMSVVYQVSVVLIASDAISKAPLPVLNRGLDDAGFAAQTNVLPAFPILTSLHPPGNQPAARLGETVTVRGLHLTGSNVRVRLISSRLEDPVFLQPLPGAGDTTLRFEIPNTPADLPAGPFQIAIELQRPGESFARFTNSLPLFLAPTITSPLPLQVTRDAEGTAIIALSCSPEVRPFQAVSLVIGEREVPSAAHPLQTASLTFRLPDAPAGDQFLRLRVDGAESLLVNRAAAPPSFDPTQHVTIS